MLALAFWLSLIGATSSTVCFNDSGCPSGYACHMFFCRGVTSESTESPKISPRSFRPEKKDELEPTKDDHQKTEPELPISERSEDDPELMPLRTFQPQTKSNAADNPSGSRAHPPLTGKPHEYIKPDWLCFVDNNCPNSNYKCRNNQCVTTVYEDVEESEQKMDAVADAMSKDEHIEPNWICFDDSHCPNSTFKCRNHSCVKPILQDSTVLSAKPTVRLEADSPNKSAKTALSCVSDSNCPDSDFICVDNKCMELFPNEKK